MMKFRRMQPPLRRVLAVDAGSRRVKLMLAQSDFGHVRVVKEHEIDLRAEGLVSPEETQDYLQEYLDKWGRPALALVLPQHLTISQVMDLPNSPEAEVEKVIRDETVKLGGVSQSRIIYDFVRLGSPGEATQRFWVTLCQEADIHERIARLGFQDEDLCEVTTTATALVTAYSHLVPETGRAILIHVGAQTTVVVILLGGLGAYASSFQMGGDFFTRALARVQQWSEEEAEARKEQQDFLRGPAAMPEFVAVVEGWVGELKRQLNDWFDANPRFATEAASFKLVVGGGGARQTGLLEYLRTEAGLQVEAWPTAPGGGGPQPSPGFEVAFGTVLQALGHSRQPVSLLPEKYREAWNKRLGRQRIEFASLVLLLMTALLLACGIWLQRGVADTKAELLAKVRQGQQAVNANVALEAELVSDYENLRPLLAARQFTLDSLQTLALLQQARSNRSYWYVLLADQQSYFTLPAVVSTNKPARTNVTANLPERGAGSGPGEVPMAKLGYIAELTVPESPDTARALLSQLVSELNRGDLFSRVDLLSEDLRRDLVEPKVVLPETHFAVALEFAATNFQSLRRSGPAGSTSGRRLPRNGPEPKERAGNPL